MDLRQELRRARVTLKAVARRSQTKACTVQAQLAGRCRVTARVERAARALLEEAEARQRAGEEAVRALRAARAKGGAGEVGEAVNP